MTKALFILGQCIRLLNMDPWEAPTLYIREIGQHSYNVGSTFRDNHVYWAEPVRFEDQKNYEKVKCPGEK